MLERDGGRDKDRTCDPYDVNVVPISESLVIAGFGNGKCDRLRHQNAISFTVFGSGAPVSATLNATMFTKGSSA